MRSTGNQGRYAGCQGPTHTVCGLMNKQVGVKLGISEITVKAHRGRVMLKMKANSFADLVKMAVTLPLAAQTADPIR
jgi:hypothetical protein